MQGDFKTQNQELLKLKSKEKQLIKEIKDLKIEKKNIEEEMKRKAE